MALLQVQSNFNEILLNTPNRNEILKAGPPQNAKCNILGKGAYGTVFKAIYQAKHVAVKIVKNLQNINLQTLQNETNILGWKHRNIVRILQIETHANFGIIIMERFASQCLQMVLDAVQLPLKHRLLITMDILAALAYCHRRSVLHLDIKPQNVLISFHKSTKRNTNATGDDVASKRQQRRRRCYLCKLCDFGASLRLSEQHQTATVKGRIKGTVRYMSPEALRERTLTTAADIYSLGITMWQLLHRQVPYSWIASNETVAYRVVKHNLRPSDSASVTLPLNAAARSTEALMKAHVNCYCDPLYPNVAPLQKLRSYTETKGHMTIETQLQQPQFLSARKIQTLQAHVEPYNLLKESSSNVPKVVRNLSSELCSKLTPASDTTSSTPFSYANCDVFGFKLETIFKQPEDFVVCESKEASYRAIYESCWQSDAKARPAAVELRKSLAQLF